MITHLILRMLIKDVDFIMLTFIIIGYIIKKVYSFYSIFYLHIFSMSPYLSLSKMIWICDDFYFNSR